MSVARNAHWSTALTVYGSLGDDDLEKRDEVVAFTEKEVVIRDLYPKSKLHWLVIPRSTSLSGPRALASTELPSATLLGLRAAATAALLRDAFPPRKGRPAHVDEVARTISPAPPAAPTALADANAGVGKDSKDSKDSQDSKDSDVVSLSGDESDGLEIVSVSHTSSPTPPSTTNQNSSGSKRLCTRVLAAAAHISASSFDPTLLPVHTRSSQSRSAALPRPSSRVRFGFHARPSLAQLHLHVISQDFSAPALKRKEHYLSFTTPFFVRIDDILAHALAHEKAGGGAEGPLPLVLSCHWLAKKRGAPPSSASTGAKKTKSGSVAVEAKGYFAPLGKTVEQDHSTAEAVAEFVEGFLRGPLRMLDDAAPPMGPFLDDAALRALAQPTVSPAAAGGERPWAEGGRMAKNMPELKRWLQMREDQ